MRLAFSTNAFTNFTVEQAIAEIGRIGYAGVEILADEPHAYPAKIDAAMTRRVVGALSAAKIAVSNVNANCTFGYWKDAPPEPYFEPSLISPVARYRADRLALITRAIEFARDRWREEHQHHQRSDARQRHAGRGGGHFQDSILRVLDVAEKFGIDVGVECEPGLYVEYIEELADWISRIDSPRLGANLDVGHCQVIGEVVSREIDRVRGRIWNLHVEGMPGRKHYHLVPAILPTRSIGTA